MTKKPEYSLVTEYEQDPTCWGIAQNGKMILVIDSREVAASTELGEKLVRLLNDERTYE